MLNLTQGRIARRDRNAGVQDPAGNFWWISTHIEDMSTEEMLKRAEAFTKAQQK
jgi:PhnB protein